MGPRYQTISSRICCGPPGNGYISLFLVPPLPVSFTILRTCIIDKSNLDEHWVSCALWLNGCCGVNDAFPIDCLTWESNAVNN